MENILIQVISGILVLIIASCLGLNNIKIITTKSRPVTKKWKVLIVISWFLLVASVYLDISKNFPNFYSEYAFKSSIFGLVTGYFMEWWNR